MQLPLCSINNDNRAQYQISLAVDFVLHQVAAEEDNECQLPKLGGKTITQHLAETQAGLDACKRKLIDRPKVIRDMVVQLAEQYPEVRFSLVTMACDLSALS